MDTYLRNIYYNPAHEASFTGPKKLYKAVVSAGRTDISLTDIKKWLQGQEPYTLQRSVRRRFDRNRVIVSGIGDQFDADLIDMVKFKKDNKGYQYILIVIDIFSKYVWLRALKNKTGKEVGDALRDIFRFKKPDRIRTDKGKEFLNQHVKDLFIDGNVLHLVTQNEMKANMAERAIKTLKSKFHRYFTYKQTYSYLDQLQNFAKSYNNTHHSSINMKPKQVNIDNETDVWWNLYWPKKTRKPQLKFKYILGDQVRISHLRNVFSREYDQKWTGEIFTIWQRYHRGSKVIYRVKDYNGEEIKGTFYENELQKVYSDEETVWKIEKILKQRTRNGQKQYYVKWLYWPDSYNSWINASDTIDL